MPEEETHRQSSHGSCVDMSVPSTLAVIVCQLSLLCATRKALVSSRSSSRFGDLRPHSKTRLYRSQMLPTQQSRFSKSCLAVTTVNNSHIQHNSCLRQVHADGLSSLATTNLLYVTKLPSSSAKLSRNRLHDWFGLATFYFSVGRSLMACMATSHCLFIFGYGLIAPHKVNNCHRRHGSH